MNRVAGGLLGLASGVYLAGCSTFGVRSVEEPEYRAVTRVGAVEIRDYGPRLAAETVVGGDQIAARGTGFRRLAGYIFGANTSRTEIAMTAPVDQSPDPGGDWRIRFFVPAHYTRETLPVPRDPGVRIVTVPAQTVAVLRYAGVPTAGAVRDADAKLLRALAGSGWDAVGTPTAWFYDPPWTLPPLRRNEAVVAVNQRSNGR